MWWPPIYGTHLMISFFHVNSFSLNCKEIPLYWTDEFYLLFRWSSIKMTLSYTEARERNWSDEDPPQVFSGVKSSLYFLNFFNNLWTTNFDFRLSVKLYTKLKFYFKMGFFGWLDLGVTFCLAGRFSTWNLDLRGRGGCGGGLKWLNYIFSFCLLFHDCWMLCN